MKTTIFVPDIHAPFHDKRAVEATLSAIKNIRPERVVLLGDVGEFEGASHWKWEKRKRPPLEFVLPFVAEDISATNDILDKFDEAIAWDCEKIFIMGNHEYRVDTLIKEHPYLEKTYGLPTSLSLRERGWKHEPLGKLVKVGPVFAYHGIHCGGINHTRLHLIKFGCNIVYGHYHDISMYSMQKAGGVIKAWSLGCLKDLSDNANEWLSGAPKNWGHCFGVMTEYENKKRDFTMDVVEISNGRCSIGGR